MDFTDLILLDNFDNKSVQKKR